MSDNFYKKVQERAYYKYLNRKNNNIPENAFEDWLEAEREENIEERINEEAFLHYLSNGDYPLLNWLVAKTEITARLEFLAFYLHQANINRSPVENWVEAQKLYIEKF